MRLFNAKTDERERQRLINTIERERMMQRMGRRDSTKFYGQESNFLRNQSNKIIERCTERLREIS